MVKEKGGAWLTAPVSGEVLPLESVPDRIFSAGMLGGGVALCPEGEEVFSPLDGWVDFVAETHHVYFLRGEDGLELLLHLGTDTLILKGRGFRSLVKSGARVSRGQPLAQMDLDYLKSQGKPFLTPVILTNSRSVARWEAEEGEVAAGAPFLSYRMKRRRLLQGALGRR